MAGSGFAQIVGDVARFQTFSKMLVTRTRKELQKALETSAAELVSRMRNGIVRQEFGLAPNTALTQELKGGSIPLVDPSSAQLVANITQSKLSEADSKAFGDVLKRFGDKALSSEGAGDTMDAWFVGVKRTAPMVQGDTKRLGTYRAISLFNVAKKMVTKHTVTLPKSGIKKNVPKRDFVSPAVKQHRKRHYELMEESVSKILRIF